MVDKTDKQMAVMSKEDSALDLLRDLHSNDIEEDDKESMSKKQLFGIQLETPEVLSRGSNDDLLDSDKDKTHDHNLRRRTIASLRTRYVMRSSAFHQRRDQNDKIQQAEQEQDLTLPPLAKDPTFDISPEDTPSQTKTAKKMNIWSVMADGLSQITWIRKNVGLLLFVVLLCGYNIYNEYNMKEKIRKASALQEQILDYRNRWLFKRAYITASEQLESIEKAVERENLDLEPSAEPPYIIYVHRADDSKQ